MTEPSGSRPESNRGQPFRLILPDQKRLREAFDSVMESAGLDFSKPSSRAAKGVTRDLKGQFPDIETYELRADAALEWISDNAADLAIVGQDTLCEFEAAGKAKDTPSRPLNILTMNQVSACSLWFAAKPEMYIQELSDLGDMRIATSYPALLQQLLAKEGVRPGRIIAQKGSVESTIPAGRADAILEIVQTGTSLAANGLEKKLPALNSSAALVRNAGSYGERHEGLIKAFAARIEEALLPQQIQVREPVFTETSRATDVKPVSSRSIPVYAPSR